MAADGAAEHALHEMTEPDDNDPHATLRREALAQVRRLVSGDATVQDLEEIKRWQSRSPDHADAFASAAKVWDRLGPAGVSVLERRGEQPLSRQSAAVQRRWTRRAVLGGAVAASAAYLVARPPFGLWPAFNELTADYRTTTGEQRRVALASGASVELNTQTSVAVRSAANELIELISGEAAIATGRELARPLVVVLGDGRVSSRNARFTVRRDSLVSCVTCLDGAVDVERQGAVVSLAARQQVTYVDRGLGSAIAIDPAVVTAWQDGLLVFHQRPLSEVVSEINRYRPGRIVLMNAELGRRSVNARFRIRNVDEIMILAERAFGAKITSLPGGIVVLS